MVSWRCLNCDYEWEGWFETPSRYKELKCPECHSGMVVERTVFENLVEDLLGKIRADAPPLEFIKAVQKVFDMPKTPLYRLLLVKKALHRIQKAYEKRSL
ncbi:MAG: hypothetical protein QXR81_07555 [Candidatus Nezhaarchaeales archaeon]